jgi:hypothetical protein
MSGDEVGLLRAKIDQLCDTLEEVRASQITMRDDQLRIKAALVGDSFGTTGLVKRVSELEEKTLGIERKFIRWTGILVGISVSFGLLKDALVHAVFGK